MLKEALSQNMIETNVSVASWQDAVNAVGQLLVHNGKVKPSFIDSMIRVVEEFGPYMILVPDIAFFHGKPGPDVHEICISFVTFKNPVYFSDFENQRIKCAFGFGAVDNESHIEMLKKIAMLLQNDHFVQLVCNNGTKEEILQMVQESEEKMHEAE